MTTFIEFFYFSNKKKLTTDFNSINSFRVKLLLKVASKVIVVMIITSNPKVTNNNSDDIFRTERIVFK